VERRKINFISNLDLVNVSGGGNSVNVATYQQLCNYYEVNFVGPIKVPFDHKAKLWSNLQGALKVKRNYHFYSNRRLEQLAQRVREGLAASEAPAHFFHGITSWIAFESTAPYYAYSDACFATYVEVFNNKDEFSPKDLQRIYDLEMKWIQKARRIFFRSRWALEETVKQYGIGSDNLHVVGLGGFIQIPDQDHYQGEKSFVFISKEFVPKGGLLCLQAFKNLSARFPGIRLKIIGDAPPEEELNGWDTIEYLGFLHKENPEEFSTYCDTIAHAFALIHPTSKDTNALVITEAGYYGCPSIASHNFAIPEFIRDGQTGLLLNVPLQVSDLETKMEHLLQLPDSEYLSMRQQVRQFTTAQNTWASVGERMVEYIDHYRITS
jgi:glycosyltransferase involved in cell wall biosynthesis